MKKVMLFVLVIVVFSSCMVTQTTVGQFREVKGKEYVYSRGKQVWLIEGLIPVGRADVATPAHGNCEVKTYYDFGDFLINTITLGLIKTYSIKVTAKK